MDLVQRQKHDPIRLPLSVRRDRSRGVTSSVAGKCVPLAFAPLLREDRVSRGSFAMDLEMMETGESLANAINVTLYTHFVPFMAFPRFEGSLNQFNRAMKKEAQIEGGSVVNAIETIAFDNTAEFWSTLGVHYVNGADINRDLLEAYNVIWNHRARMRSSNITERVVTDTTLAPAFWKHTGFSHIVPDFEDAMLDGEVTLNIQSAQLPVTGIGVATSSTTNPGSDTIRETGGTTRVTDAWNDAQGLRLAEDPDNAGFPAVFAELTAQNITLGLQNFELAKKTRAFAKLREQYADKVDNFDDWAIDMLMSGIRVPEEQMAHPILLDRQETIIGLNTRYATDGANLDEHVSTGRAALTTNFRTPAMNTGGLVMVTAEVVPEQLWERKKDYYLATTDPDDFPQNLSDYLDPQKVSLVQNDHADVLHSTPSGTFGYGPLNHEWQRDRVNVGGKYYREPGDPANTDRQKIWTVETTDPALTTDFYVVNNLHAKVFEDTLADHFEIVSRLQVELVGLTQFGKALTEDTGQYAAVDAVVDKTRIEP